MKQGQSTRARDVMDCLRVKEVEINHAQNKQLLVPNSVGGIFDAGLNIRHTSSSSEVPTTRSNCQQLRVTYKCIIEVRRPNNADFYYN